MCIIIITYFFKYLNSHYLYISPNYFRYTKQVKYPIITKPYYTTNTVIITVPHSKCDDLVNSSHNCDFVAEEAAEYIMKELNAIMFLVTNSNAGTISVIMDNNSSAADMQARIRALGTTVGPNNIDVTGSDVAAGTSVVVS